MNKPNRNRDDFQEELHPPEGYRLPQVQANPDYVNRFPEKFPGQVEHCLRLTMERLQLGLDKRSDPKIQITNKEVAELAEAAYALYSIYIDIK